MKILGYNFKLFGGGMKRIEWVLPYVRGKDVLDIGVVQHSPTAYDHPSWLHKHVASASRSCLGIDIAEKELELLRQRGFNVRYADAQDFDLGQEFDVIVAGDIIEHLHDLKGFFRSIDKHLRPGGQFLIMTCNPWFGVRLLQALRGSVYANPEHTAWFSVSTMAELLRRFDYRIAEWCYGSSEGFLYKVPAPKIIRHTSIWFVAERA